MKIKILNKTVMEYFRYYYMQCDLRDISLSQVNSPEYHLEKINEHNMKMIEDGLFSLPWIKNFYRKGFNYVDGYMFLSSAGELISYCLLVFKGGEERICRVRNVDAYIAAVYTSPSFRGKGFFMKLFQEVFIKLQLERGIQTIGLLVRPDNESALRAYKKIGFTVVDEKRFIRLLRFNIPFIEL